MNLDAAFDAATRRLYEYINRCIGQKLRRQREADQRAKADADAVHTSAVSVQRVAHQPQDQ